MQMSHVYQPVILRLLIDKGGGKATVSQVAQALSAEDPSTRCRIEVGGAAYLPSTIPVMAGSLELTTLATMLLGMQVVLDWLQV